VHARPHTIPGGSLVTTPPPTRSTVKLRGSAPSLSSRTAPTLVGLVTTIVQIAAAPAQAPPQLASTDPRAGSATRSITLPLATVCVQVVVQLESNTRSTPLPEPEIETVNGTRALAAEIDRPGDGSAPAETRSRPASVQAAHRATGRRSRDLTPRLPPLSSMMARPFACCQQRARRHSRFDDVGNVTPARSGRMRRARIRGVAGEAITIPMRWRSTTAPERPPGSG
jgi:hypothetical protein